MKITYKTNVLNIIRLVENNTPALWEKEYNNFPNTWGCKRLIGNDQPTIF